MRPALIAGTSWMLVAATATGGAEERSETCFGRPATHVGTPGADTIVGTPGDDVG
jgi:hypothetical protein